MFTFRLKNNHWIQGDDEELLFEIQGGPYKVSIAQFHVSMGIYDVDFKSLQEIGQLPFENSSPTSYVAYQNALTSRDNYNPEASKFQILEILL